MGVYKLGEKVKSVSPAGTVRFGKPVDARGEVDVRTPAANSGV